MLHIVGDINFTDSDFNVGFGIGSRITQGFDPLKNIAPTKVLPQKSQIIAEFILNDLESTHPMLEN